MVLREQIERRRLVREELLIGIYEAVGGRSGFQHEVQRGDIASDRFDARELEDATEYLRDEQLLDVTDWESLHLTPLGVAAAEQLLLPTDDEDAQIIDAVEVRKIEAFSTELELAIERGDVDAPPDTLEEIRDLLLTMQAQLGKRPRRRIMKAIAGVIGQLLTSAGGSGAYELAKRIPDLFA